MNNEQFRLSRERSRLFTLRSTAHVERFQRFIFSAMGNSRLNASAALSPLVAVAAAACSLGVKRLSHELI